MENLDLTDIWRVLNQDKFQFTWKQRVTNVSGRLDYFIISTSLINTFNKTSITHGFLSDHSFIQINLEKDNIKRGPGFF